MVRRPIDSVTMGPTPAGRAATSSPAARGTALAGQRRTRSAARARATIWSRIRKRLDGPGNNVFVVLVVLLFGALLAYLTFALTSTGSEQGRPTPAIAGVASGDSAVDRARPAAEEAASISGCMVDTDCGQGQSCRMAACEADPVTGTECRIDHDCRVGQACRDGSCVAGVDSAL